VDGIASPQRSRSRPDVNAITSSCDVNHKGNWRAKVMPGLSGGFHCGPRNLSPGSQCLCPYVGSCFWAAGTNTGSGQSGRQLDQYMASRHALVQVKSQCARGARVTVGVSQVYALFGGSTQRIYQCIASRCLYCTQG
jgi:hypothetical protein